jgi:hypothetical protein
MKFRLKRASNQDNRTPHPKAVLEYVDCVEIRLEKRIPELWYTEGYNHSSYVNEFGHTILYRTVNNLCWTIEINDISEVFELHHSVVVDKMKKYDFKLPTITIYDDYLE